MTVPVSGLGELHPVGAGPRTLLQQLLDADNRSLPEICDAFQRLATEIGERTTLTTRTLQYWAAGDVREPRPARRRVAERFWGFPFAELVGPPRLIAPARPGSGQSLVRLSAESGAGIGESVRTVLDGCRRLDASVGPRGTLDTVTSLMPLVSSLVEASRGERQDHYLAMLAEMHQLAGWMWFDLGDLPAARRALEQARTLAQAAGDDLLVSYVLGPSLGFAEVDSGRPQEGLDLIYTAQTWARRSGNKRLQAFTLAMGARAHAKLGDERLCREQIKESGDALARHRPTRPDPFWLHVFDDAALLGHTGSSLLDLGHAGEASTLLGQEDASSPHLYVRNRSIWLLDRATAFRELGEVEQACDQATEALDLIGSTTSPRTWLRLARFRSSLGEWQDTEHVRELFDRLNDGPLTAALSPLISVAHG
jgi:tetratricopeptide (TPR) repeat protein